MLAAGGSPHLLKKYGIEASAMPTAIVANVLEMK
jgi:hypothetical protein